MLLQDVVQVKPVEYHSGPEPHRREIWSKVFLEGSPLDPEVGQCLLAVVAPLIHRPRPLAADRHPLPADISQRPEQSVSGPRGC